MMIYWILLIFAVGFFFICQMYYNTKCGNELLANVEVKKLKVYFVAVSIFMICLIGLRGKYVGRDTINYFNIYQSFKDTSFADIFYSDTKEKGYAFLQILFNKLGFSFYGFDIAYAIFNITIISYLIYKKSDIPWLSYFLYICFSFFILELTMMRQTIAMSIVVLAVLLDKNRGIKDFIKFAVIIFLASLVHSSAIICIPLWFIRKIPYGKLTAMFLLVITGVSFVMQSFSSNLIARLAADVSEKYESYMAGISQGGEVGYKLYFMILVSAIFGLFVKKFLADKWNQFLLYCMFIMLIIFPAVQSGGAIMRIYYYFYIFMIIYIPNMIAKIDQKKDRGICGIVLFLYILVGLYMFYSTLSGNSLNIMPYQFFWQA